MIRFNEKRDEANTYFAMVFSVFVILLAGVVVLFTFDKNALYLIEEYTNSSIVEANLSSAIVDLDTCSYGDGICYGKIIDTNEAFELYADTLKNNLNLESTDNITFIPAQSTLNIKKLEIKDYIIFDVYNNSSNEAVVSARNKNGYLKMSLIDGYYQIVSNGGSYVYEKSECPVSQVKSPDGTIIVGPAIYSKILMTTDFYFDNEYQISKQNTVVVQGEY